MKLSLDETIFFLHKDLKPRLFHLNLLHILNVRKTDDTRIHHSSKKNIKFNNQTKKTHKLEPTYKKKLYTLDKNYRYFKIHLVFK